MRVHSRTSTSAEQRGNMSVSGWVIVAWLAIAAVTALRVAFVVGVVAVVVAIVHGVLAVKPSSHIG